MIRRTAGVLALAVSCLVGGDAAELSTGVVSFTQHLQNVGERVSDGQGITNCQTAIASVLVDATGIGINDIDVFNMSWHIGESQTLNILKTQYHISASSSGGYNGLIDEFDRISSAIADTVHSNGFTTKLRDYASSSSCASFSEALSYVAPTEDSQEVQEVHSVLPTSSPTSYDDPSQHIPYVRYIHIYLST
jgi:hypothetical protein